MPRFIDIFDQVNGEDFQSSELFQWFKDNGHEKVNL